MRQGISEEINRIILVIILAAVFGLLSGYFLLSLVSGIALYSAWLLYQTRAFYLWIEENDGEYPPDYGGIWGDIFDIIYRYRHGNRLIQLQLKQQLAQIKESMNAMQSGVVAMDNDDHIQWWNPEAQKLLGFKEGYDAGKPIHNLVRHPKFIDYLQAKDFDKTLLMPSPASSNISLEIQISVFGNKQKILMVKDISRLVRLEQMRKDFVANVSHELRTPLTVINGYLEILESNLDTFPEQWHTPLNKISDQSSRMTEIVEDLSVLSRLDNDEGSNSKVTVAVKPLLNKIIKHAPELRSELDIDISIAGEDFNLEGSEAELHSCFSNIVFNAVKYAKVSGLKMTIALENSETEKRIAFSDNGIGIDPIHIPRLTERFYRADKSHSRTTGGTGLGLAIVKHILLRHDGELRIKSTLGKGSTFTCSFPS